MVDVIAVAPLLIGLLLWAWLPPDCEREARPPTRSPAPADPLTRPTAGSSSPPDA